MNIRSFLSSFRNIQNSHIIEDILNSENPTLEILMENDQEFIQELKNRNTNLLKFFTPIELDKVLDYITTDPEIDDYRLAHKYPFVCNEIILAEIPDLIDIFFHESHLLDKLFSFLELSKYNILLYGYVSNAILMLLKHNSYELLSYIHEQKDIGIKLPYYLFSTSIMDLMLKLLGCEDHGNPAYISKLYEMIDLILNNLTSPKQFNEDPVKQNIRIVNSGILLANLLTNHNDVVNWSEIQLQLSTSPNIERLLEMSIKNDDEIGVASISILLALIQNIDNNQTEDNLISDETPFIIELLYEHITEYKEMLLKNSQLLGMYRLKLCKMIFEYVKLNYPQGKKTVIEYDILSVFIVKFI